MDNPLDVPMPSFDPDVTEPTPPKKPKPRPTRKKPAKKAAPKVAGKLYTSRPGRTYKKRSTAKRRKPRQTKPVTVLVSVARLPALMDASESIATILESLSREERDIVLSSPRVMKHLS